MSRKFLLFYASTIGVTLYLSLVFGIVHVINRIDLPIDNETEAIGISARSSTFQKELKRAWNLIETHDLHPWQPSAKAYYWDTSTIKWHKTHNPDAAEVKNLPDNHGVWKVDWNAAYFGLLQFINEQTGEIHYERVSYFP